MKKTLAISLLLAATAVGSFAQGTINFANIFGTAQSRTFLAPIYAPDPANPLMELRGNTSAGVPAGTTVYGGGVLNTAGYVLGLFIGETQIGASQVIRTSATGALPAGTIATTTLTVPNVAAGLTAVLEVRAWDTRGGVVDTWAKALADTSVAKGRSGVFTTGRLGGIDADGFVVTAPNTVGWTSFNVAVVPEPSTIALGVLGLGSLLLFRRRQAK